PTSTVAIPTTHTGRRIRSHSSLGWSVPLVGTCLVARCWIALASPKLAAPATAAGTATKNSVDVELVFLTPALFQVSHGHAVTLSDRRMPPAARQRTDPRSAPTQPQSTQPQPTRCRW